MRRGGRGLASFMWARTDILGVCVCRSGTVGWGGLKRELWFYVEGKGGTLLGPFTDELCEALFCRIDLYNCGF